MLNIPWHEQRQWPSRGYYIGTIVDNNTNFLKESYYTLPSSRYEEPLFISVDEEFGDRPIKVNFAGWRRHIVFTTGE